MNQDVRDGHVIPIHLNQGNPSSVRRDKPSKLAICRLASAVVASPYVHVRLGDVLDAHRHLIQF